MRRSSAEHFAVIFLSIIAACTSEPTESRPVAQVRPLERFPEAQVRKNKTIADEWRELADAIPGFQSVYYDSAARLTINVAADSLPSTSRAYVLQWVRRYTGVEVTSLEPQLRRVLWDYGTLDRYYKPLIRSVATSDWVTSGRIDDRRGVIIITVDDLARSSQVLADASALGIPREMVVVEQLSRPTLDATLQQNVRPVHGGLQIESSVGACTLGLNGYKAPYGYPDPSQPVFMTAAHCTNVEGQVTGTVWGQPTLSTPIGFEIHQAPRIYPPTCPCESPRDCRRLHSMRGWSHAKTESVLT
jgi:hypothetical protein